MRQEITCFRSGSLFFVATPELDQVCASAGDWAARCNRKAVEAVDLLLALYYGARTEVSSLLQMAVKMHEVDGAALEHWHSDLCGVYNEDGYGPTGRAVLSGMAELSVHYRGVDEDRVAMLTSADLAVALLNDEEVNAALVKAGVSRAYLRHLESALRLEERKPLNLDTPTPNATTGSLSASLH